MQPSVQASGEARVMEARAVGARAGKEIGAKAKEIGEREEKEGVAKGTEKRAKEVSRDRARARLQRKYEEALTAPG